MARLVFGLNQSLDGYIDHTSFAPEPAMFDYFVEDMRALGGSLYGRRMYEVMRYWDEDQPDWDEPRRAFAQAWRNQPKWVVSRTLKEVGPNAILISEDVEAAVAEVKADVEGVMEVAGPELAASLFHTGLIDEYRIYLHPAVVGAGKPFFAAPPPPLRLLAVDRIGEQAVRLRYVPA
ncbi:MAG: dihydrofolate reductase [Brevundimonas sp.]|nr:MAG: dihydrofolate reductase [Brevundimonas sp.]